MRLKLKFILIILPILIGASLFFKVNLSRATCSADEISQLIEESKKCSTIGCLSSLLSRLETCKAETQGKKEKAAADAAKLQDKVNDLGSSIGEKNASINSLNSEITNLEYEINKLFSEIKEIEKRMKKNKAVVKAAVKNFYEYDRENIITIILAQNSISEFFDEVFYVGNIQKKVSEIVGQLKKDKKNLDKKKKELANRKEVLEINRATLTSQRNALAQEKAQQDTLLGSAQSRKNEYARLNSELAKRTKEIYTQISGTIGGSCGIALKCPFDGICSSYITQSYGCLHTDFARSSYKSCDGGKGGFHNGIDFGIPCGTPLKASTSGTVVGSSHMGDSAYGLWLAIKYDNGLYALYGHLSSITASGRVQAGEIIATSGTTGYSTGCHLHFTTGKSLFGGLPSINTCGPAVF